MHGCCSKFFKSHLVNFYSITMLFFFFKDEVIYKKKNSPFPLVGVRNVFTEEMTTKQDFERWIAVKYSFYCKVGMTEEIDVFSNDLIVITLSLLPRPSPKVLAEPVHARYHISPKPELIDLLYCYVNIVNITKLYWTVQFKIVKVVNFMWCFSPQFVKKLKTYF